MVVLELGYLEAAFTNNPGSPTTWTSNMPNTMNPILPVLSLFRDIGPLFWAHFVYFGILGHYVGHFGGPVRSVKHDLDPKAGILAYLDA